MQHKLKASIHILLSLFLFAVATASAANESQAVRQSVEENTANLVAKLNQERSTYYDDPEKFFGSMEEALQDVIDFRRIAARVMGRYRREASATQKDQFVETFKRSLFSAYGKTLVESGEFEIDVMGADINPRYDDRASVDLEITTSSGKYPVIYNMYKNSESQKWLLENVIVNGVNIGLAFRDRFEQQYETHKGDLDKVIDSWSSELASEQVAEEAN